MIKRWLILAGWLVILGWGLWAAGLSQADELDEIEKQLNQLRQAYQMSVNATKPLESEVKKMQSQIYQLEKRIKKADQDLDELEQSIFQREVDREYQRQLLQQRIRRLYINSRVIDPWLSLLAGPKRQNLILELFYKQSAAQRDRQLIAKASQQLYQLDQDKKKLEKDRARLAAIKKEIQQKKTFLNQEIAKAKQYQKDLTRKISELSKRQQELLAAKTGTFVTSVGDVPLTGDPASRPDYDPGFRPAYAAFSFGAPHFKGMSQYGAKGRAAQGQSYEQIIKAYYGDVRIEHRSDLPASIPTRVGTLALETSYLYGVAEMPSSWTEGNLNALKAQAIVSRTYALAYTGWRIGGPAATRPICTSETCQVWHSSKSSHPPDSWRQAVDQTKGMIVVSNRTNQLFSTLYAASSGGFQRSYTSLAHPVPSLWDTRCSSQSCWTSEAFEKIAGSPWFYKAWYKSRSGKTCGRSHPWLNQSELADIVNSALIVSRNGDLIKHVSQIDGCLGQDPEAWSQDQIRQKAAEYGGPVSQIHSIQAVYSTQGYTSQIKFQTDKGEFSFSGKNFKLVFNLRAPGLIHIKSSLFNLEKK